jgi:pseudouridylate synthase
LADVLSTTPSGPGSITDRLRPSTEVVAAIRSRTPVVALESTLISHGLPFPQNLEVARSSEAAVRSAGAVPATIAIRDGSILVGLADADLEALASAPEGSVRKTSRPTLAAALGGGWAATTVSATMIAAHAAGIRVFATGGIGGVHVGAIGGPSPSFDISSDLEELARTPIVVVCAGPKSILDVAATIEYLETRGVPVVTVGQEDVPGFVMTHSGVASPAVTTDIPAAADLAATHLALGLGSAMLVCMPVPGVSALPDDVGRRAIDQAHRDAEAARIAGPAVTPWVLARVAELTDGASVRANTALIANNAGAAAVIALRLGSRQ